MLIRDMSFTPVSVPFLEPEMWSKGERLGASSIIVQVTTDEGITGVGEAIPLLHPQACLGALETMRELLMGEDAFAIERHRLRLEVLGGFYHTPRVANALWAGIEMALWDILGRAHGQPVAALLGGVVRAEVPVMYYVQRKDTGEMAAEAAGAAALGWRTVYAKVGFDFWKDVEVVRSLRQAIGPEVNLRVDANEAWSVGTTLRFLRLVEDCDLEYIEQPLANRDNESLRSLRGRSQTPIAANQSSWSLRDLYQVIASGAADIVMTDPHQAGGIQAFKKAAGIAEASGTPLVLHSFGGLTITVHAALQVVGSSSAFYLANQAYNHLSEGRVVPLHVDDVVVEPISYEGGCVKIPTGPGLGVELDHDKLRRFAERYARDGYASAYLAENERFLAERGRAGRTPYGFPFL